MVTWFQAGGWVMFPILTVGVMAVVVAARHAAVPRAGGARAARTARQVVAAFGVAGAAMGVATTLDHASAVSGEIWARIVAIGLGESMSPLVFAAGWVGLAALFSLAGDLRDSGAGRRAATLLDDRVPDMEPLRAGERLRVDRQS